MRMNNRAQIDQVAAPDSETSRRWRLRTTSIARSLLVLAVLLTFCRACCYDFVNLDDDQTLVHNPLMNPPTMHSLKVWWSSPCFQLYDPMTATVRGGIALLARVSPDPDTGDALNPWVFHTANIATHIAVALLVYQLLLYLRMQPWPACAGALLFAIHPVQVEPVVWITSIKDLLYGMFGLLAVWRFLVSLGRTDEPTETAADRTGAIWNFSFATLCFVLAMLSKPTAVVLPLVALPLVWLQHRTVPLRAWFDLGIWLALAMPFAIIASLVQPSHYTPYSTTWQRFLVAGDAIAFYLFKITWPKTLMVYYGRNPAYVVQSGFNRWTWIIPISMIAFLWVNRRRWPPVWAGMCVFVAGLLPVLGLLRFNFQYFSTVADRYLYVPMVGVALIVSWAVARLPRAGGMVAALFLLCFAGRSFMQVPYWRDSLTLYHHVLDNDPRSAAACEGLANSLSDYQQSIEWAQRSIELDPHRCEPYGTLGRALDRLGRTDEALQTFRNGFKMDSRTGTLLDRYTMELLQRGDMEHALMFARLNVELVPTAITRVNLAAALAGTNDWEGARRELKAAVALDPENYNAQMNLAFALYHLGDRAGAITHLRAAASIDPDDPRAAKALETLGANIAPARAPQP